jgi:hypothetical protein
MCPGRYIRQVGCTDPTGEVEQLDVDDVLRYHDLGSSRVSVTEVQLNLTDFGGERYRCGKG